MKGSDHTHKYIKNITRGKHASFLARVIGKKIRKIFLT
jgi:hypothetical protein